VTTLHVVLGAALLAANLAAGAYGALIWWRGGDVRGFWPLLRTAQALVALQALFGAILAATGRDLPDLHLVYGLTPLGVSFVAEQLRALSAQAELEHAGLEDAQAVGRLPEERQLALVDAIVRREIGVMAASSLVIAVLAVRAAGWL
jgi:hypothetical protein